MIEPDIKYENCEEIYSSPTVGNGESQVSTEGSNNCIDNGITQQQQRLKRNYNDHLEDMIMAKSNNGGGVGTENTVGPLHGNQFGSNNSYNPNIPTIDNYYTTEQTPMQQTQELFKIKRQRRAESSILFSHPFFNLQDDWDTIRSRETITAKCLSCMVILRGHKNVSSNFIKHMKRLHPELYKVYENYKLLKFKGFTQNIDASNVGGYPPQDQSAYFDATAFLEHMATTVSGEQQQSTTATDQSTINSINNNINAQGSDTLEYSGDSNTDAPTPVAPTRSTSGVRLVSQERILDAKAVTNEVDLSAKTLDQMSRLLDQKLNGFVTKAELEVEKESTMQQIEKIVAETVTAATNRTTDATNTRNNDNVTKTTNINTTDESMQVQINELKNECQQLRAAVQRAQSSKKQLQKELQIMDRTMRQRKVIIRNVPLLSADETARQAATRILRDFLKLNDVQILNAFLMRQQNPNNKKQNVLLELQKAADAKAIFSSCYKLKNTGIMVDNELSPAALRRKSKLLVLRKEILRRNAKLKVIVRNAQLIISGKQFYWDDVEGLSVGNLLEFSCTNNIDGGNEQNAAEHLKQITDLDMNEFLNVLKNYDVK